MSKAKVWNDNVHPYTEEFKGTQITIPPHEYVEMDYEEAIEFKGTFGRGLAPIGKDGAPDAKYFKMIRVEGTPSHLQTGFIHPATGKRYESQDEYNKALAEFARDNADRVVKEPGASKDDKIAELAAQVAALTAMVQQGQAQSQRQKPGPKPKAKVG